MPWSHHAVLVVHTFIQPFVFSFYFFLVHLEGNKLVALSATVNIELSALISFFSPFFQWRNCWRDFYCKNILKLHDKCATSSLRCSLLFTITKHRRWFCIIISSISFELNFLFLCKKNWLGSKSSINYLFCVRLLFLFALHAFKEDIRAKLLNFVGKRNGRDWKRVRRPNGTPRRNIDFVFLKSANQFWLSIISFWVDHKTMN